jgi:Na+/H+-dicarboxylate symporter
MYSRPYEPDGWCTALTLLHLLRKLLSHPATILGSVGFGLVVGFQFPTFSHGLRPIAQVYIALLSMCLLPILVSALPWGIGQMLRTPQTRELFGRMAVIYAVGLLIPCVVGLAVAGIFQPGAALGEEAKALLGSELQGAGPGAETGGLLGFVETMIPPNVFAALSKGQFISIVFFAALAGLGLGVVRAPGADEALRVLNALYQTFSTVFSWVLIPLPIGLFSIVAYNISQAERELLNALLAYVAFFWLAGLLVIAAHAIVLSIATRTAPWRPFVALKTPLVLAFATDNPFIALYSAIDALQKHYRVRREVADTIVPFGVLANQHGQVLLFAFTAPFLAQVYGVELGPTALLTLGLGVIVSGAAAVAGGAALAPILAPVLLGAGVPDALAVVILATTQPMVANLSSTVTVQATCNLAVLTARGRTEQVAAEEPPSKGPDEEMP